MTTTIDCSRMSHASCYAAEELEPTPSAGAAPAPAGTKTNTETHRPSDGASYECINDCVSSLGVTALLSSAVTSLGCIMVLPAWPIFIGTSVGSMLGACNVACEELESKP